MSLKLRLKETLKEALRAKDQVKLDAVRSVLSAIQYAEIEKGVDELPEEAILGLIRTEIKKRKEELEYAEKAAREDLKAKLVYENSVLEVFLPQQLAEAELEKTLLELKAQTPGLNVGAAMKILKEKYPGQFDGKLASDLARKLLG